ncbi:hypothetical protein [Methanolapillus ohkumae]|uniref:Uncharacterized protein n=1 Tax=Methanolapillus ohkumae TaxID=3028298 RepID=A0AA97A6A0_9EURY|nr:hypothetical protein MsAm2_09340 [Methanosarcinaceae archaeon Am2]
MKTRKFAFLAVLALLLLAALSIPIFASDVYGCGEKNKQTYAAASYSLENNTVANATEYSYYVTDCSFDLNEGDSSSNDSTFEEAGFEF